MSTVNLMISHPNGTSEYRIEFSRYDSTRGRINSAPVSVQAESFLHAVKLADTRLEGMRDADPNSDYKIKSIGAAHYGGVTSTDHFNIFGVTNLEDTD